jgi:hypothetical protein
MDSKPGTKKTWHQIKMENYERRKKRRLENAACMNAPGLVLPPGWPALTPNVAPRLLK